MRRALISMSAAIFVGLFAGCASGGSGAREKSSSTDHGTSAPSSRPAASAAAREKALGLTRRLRRAYRGVCSMQAARAPVRARRCPPLIPTGRLEVAYRGRSLGRDGPDGGFSADLASRSLDQLDGRRITTNGGHWRYDVAWSPGVRRTVVQMSIRRPLNARESSSCRETLVAARRMFACRVVPYERGGGVNGGHIVYVWDHARVTYAISIHGYAHEPRARAMMAALTAAAGC
jgi:hypothetical protein